MQNPKKPQSSTQLTPIAQQLAGRKGWLAGLSAALAPGLALAGPSGGDVVAGSAAISAPDSHTTQIDQHSQSAIINWQQFSVGAEEFVLFNQPSSSAVVLNRVIGGSMSEILGQMQANGQVFLVNPMGVLFGHGSRVDVGGLVATTLDISDADFHSGNYVFSGASTAGIHNRGTITADQGFVVLSADQVQNTGLIQAIGGNVVLASAGGLSLDIDGRGLISYQIDQAALSELAGIDNLGQIIADGGAIALHADVARQLAGTVINNQGQLQARGIAEGDGGEIYLTASGGDIVHNGSIDVSGARGGTTRLIASDHLQTTAESRTLAHGADPLSGGFIELSGHESIHIRGEVNVAGGRLLLDPTTFTIGNGSDCNADICETFLESQLTRNNVDAVATDSVVLEDLSDGEITSSGTFQLRLGIGEVSYGGAYTRGTGGGTITFQDSSDKINIGGDLKVIGGQASGSIAVGGLRARSVEVDTGGSIQAGDVQSTGGSIHLTAGTGIQTGKLTADDSGFEGSGADASLTINAGGNVDVGTIDTEATASGFSQIDADARVKITAGGTLKVNGSITTSGRANGSSGSSGTADAQAGVELSGSGVDVGAISTTANANQSGSTSRGSSRASIQITSTAGATQTGSLSANALYTGGSGSGESPTRPVLRSDITIQSVNNVDVGGSIFASHTNNGPASNSDHSSAIKITVTGGGINVGNNQLSARGLIDLSSAGGTGIQTGTLQAENADLSVVAGAGGITINGQLSGGSSAKDALSDVKLDAAGALSFGNTSLTAGSVILRSGAALSLGSDFDITTTEGGVVLDAKGALSAGDISTTDVGSNADVRVSADGAVQLGTITATATGSGAVDDASARALITAGRSGTGALSVGAITTRATAAAVGAADATVDLIASNAPLTVTGNIDAQAVANGSSKNPTANVKLTTSGGNIQFRGIRADASNSTGGTANANITVTGTNSGNIRNTVATDQITASANATSRNYDVSLRGEGDIQVGDITGEFLTVDIPAALTLGSVDVIGQSLKFTGDLATGDFSTDSSLILNNSGGAITMGTVNSLGTVSLTAGNGDLQIKDAVASSGLTLRASAGNVNADKLTAGSNTTVEALGNVLINGDLNAGTSTVNVLTRGSGTLTLQNVTGGHVTIGGQSLGNQTGNIQVGNITASNNLVIESEANGVSVSGIAATNGSIVLRSGTGMNIGGNLTSTGSLIRVDAGDGDLSLNSLSAASGIDLDARNGSITLASATADADLLNGGSLNILAVGTDTASLPASLNASGALAGSTVTLQAIGNVSVAGVTSSNNIDVTAGGNISATGNWSGGTDTSFDGIDVQSTGGGTITLQDLTAGDLFIGDLNSGQSTGTIQLGTLTATDAIIIESSAGDIAIDAITPAGGLIDLHSESGGITVGGNLRSTGNQIRIDAAQGDLNLGALEALSGITLQADNGAISLSSANSDTDSTSSGSLNITASGTDTDLLASSITASGALSGNAITLNAAGDINVNTLTSLNNILVTSGGDITATGNWTGGTATSFDDIDVQTTSGGSISLKDLSAGDLFIGDLSSTQNTGDITLGTLTAADAITVESNGGDISITAINPAGGAIDLSTGLGSISVGGDLTSTGSRIDVDAADGPLALANLSALSGITLQARNGSVSLNSADADTDGAFGGTLSISAAGTDTDALPAGITISGALAGSAVLLNAAGSIQTVGITSLNNIGVTAGGDITATGNWTGGTATSFDDIDVQSTSGGNITLLDLQAGDLLIGDFISSHSTGNISLGTLSATDTIQIETNGGDLSIVGMGSVGGHIDLLASSGSITVGGDITSSGSSIDIEAAQGDLNFANLRALTGIFLRTGNGAISLTSANADTDGINGGSLSITAAGVDSDALPATITASGDLSGNEISLSAPGSVLLHTLNSLNGITVTSGGDISATGNWTAGTATSFDDIDVQTTTGGSITLKDLSAGDLFIGDLSSNQNTGNITLGTLTASDSVLVESNGGNIQITAINPAGGHINLFSAAGSLSVGGEITSTGSSIEIEAAQGDLSLANLSALSGISLTTGNGSISLANANADTDKINGGTLNFTASGTDSVPGPARITASGTLAGDSINLTAAGDISTDTLSSLNNIFVTSGGNINASGNWSAGTAVSFDAIDVQTTSGGTISLKDLSAGDLFIGDFSSAHSTGDITLGTLSASDSVQIESNGGNIQITAIQPVGGFVDIHSESGTLTVGGDISSQNSSINLESAQGGLTLANLNARTGISLRSGNGTISLTSAHADTDSANGGNLFIDANGVGSAITASGAMSGNAITLDAISDVNVDRLDSANNIVVTSGGNILASGNWTAGAATSFDDIDVQSLSGGTITLKDLSAGDLFIGDFSSAHSTGDIQLGTLNVSDDIFVETDNGNLTITAINSVGGRVDLHTVTGSIQVGGDIDSLTDLIDIDAGNGDLVLGNLRAINGVFLRTDNGDIQVASANADSDLINGGNLNFTATGVGNSTLPAAIRASGLLSGNTVALNAAGDVDVAAVTSLNDIFVIAGGNISASGDWTGGTASSFDAIDVQTTGGGSILLQNLNAGDILIGDQASSHSAGNIVVGDVTATDQIDIESDSGTISTGALSSTNSSIDVQTNNADMSVGGALAPNLVRLNAGSGTLALGGLVQSNLVDILAANVAGSLIDIHQLSGALTLNTGLISAPSIRVQTEEALTINGALDAGSTGTISLLSSNSSVSAGNVTAQDLGVAATQLQFGNLSLGGLLDLDASSGNIQLGQVTAGTVDLLASGNLNYVSLDAAGNAILQAGANIIGGNLGAADLQVNAGQNLQLTGAAIQAQTAQLLAQAIQLDGSQIDTLAGGFSAVASVSDLSAQNATATVAGNLDLQATQANILLSGATLSADDAIRIAAAQGLQLSNATLSAGTDTGSTDFITLQAQSISNAGGQYSAAGDFSAIGGRIRLQGSTISVGNDIAVHATTGSAELDNATLTAGGDAALTAEHALLLRGASIQVGGNAFVEARGSGTSGALEADGLELSAGSALLRGLNIGLNDARLTTTNADLGVLTGGNLQADRATMQSAAGIVLTADRLSVRSTSLGAGSASSTGNLDLFGTTTVDASDATLGGGGQLTVQAPAASLAGATGSFGGDAFINATSQSLDFQQATLSAATLNATAATTLLADGAQITVSNHALLQAQGSGSSDGLAASALSLDAGSATLSGQQVDLIDATVITRSGDLILNASGGELALDNGSYTAAGNLSAQATDSETAAGEMVIAGSELRAAGTLTLAADQAINDLGESSAVSALLSAQQISLDAARVNLAANGALQATDGLTISSGGDLTIGSALNAGTITVSSLGATQLASASASSQLNIDSVGNLRTGALSAPDLQARSQTGALDLGALNAGSTGSVILQAASTLSSGNIDTLNLQANAQALSFADIAIGGALQLNASAGDLLVGTVNADSVNLSASGNLNYTTLTSSGNAILQAGANIGGGNVQASELQLNAGQNLQLADAAIQAQTAQLSAQAIQLDGSQISTNSGGFTAIASLNNLSAVNASADVTGDLNLQATQANILLNGADLAADDAIQVSAAQRLQLSSATLSAGTDTASTDFIRLKADHITNAGAQYSAAGDFSAIGGRVRLQGSTISVGNNITVHATTGSAELENATLTAGGDAALTAQQALLLHGANIQVGGDAFINATSQSLDFQQATLSAATLNATAATTLLADGAQITVSNHALLQAQGSGSSDGLAASALSLDAGSATLSGQQVDLIDATVITRSGDLILNASGGELALDNGSYTAAGNLSAQATDSETAAGEMVIAGSELRAAGTLTLAADQAINDLGESSAVSALLSAQQISLDAARVNLAANGALQATDGLTISSGGDLTIGSALNAGTITVSSLGATQLASASASSQLNIDSVGNLRTGALSAPDLQARSQTGALDLGALNAGSTGSVILQAASTLSSGNIDTLNLQANAQALSFADIAIGGALQLNASAGDLLVGTVNADSVNLSASGNLNYTALTSSGDARLQAGTRITGGQISANAIALSGTEGVNTGGALNAANVSVVSDNGELALSAINTGTNGSVVLQAASTLITGNIDTSDLQASAQALNFADVTIGGALNLNASTGNLVLGTVDAGDITLNAGGDIRFAALRSAADASLQAGQQISGGAINGAEITLDAGDSIALSGALDGSQITLSAINAISLADASSSAGDLSVNGGSIVSAGALSATGGAILRSTAGDIDSGNITASSIRLDAGGAISVTDARLEATGSTLDLDARAGNADLSGATLLAASGITVDAGTAGGAAFDLILSDASLTAPTIDLRATGQVVNAGSVIRGNDYSVNAQLISMRDTDVEVSGQANYTAVNSIDLSGARIRSAGLTLNAGSALNLIGADVASSQATTASGSNLNLNNLLLNAGTLSLTSTGNLTASNAQLRSAGAISIVSGGQLDLGSALWSGSNAVLQSSGNMSLGSAELSSLDARSSAGSINANELVSSGQMLLRASGALNATQLNAQTLNLQASSANLSLVSSSGGSALQFSGDASISALQASQGATISSGGNLSVGSLQGAGNSSLSAGNNLVSNSIRLGGANLSATAGNQLRIGAQTGGVILQAGNADLSGTNAILLQNGSISVNQLLARSTGIIALDSVQLAANQSLIQAGLADLSGDNTKANEGLLQLRDSDLQVTGLLELEAAGTVESLAGNGNRIRAGALGVRAGNRIDLRTAQLQTGSATVPFGGDSTLLSQLRARGASGLPSSNQPNAVFQAGNALALGDLQMGSGYLVLRSDAMSFNGTIASTDPLFVNIRSASAAPIQIENADFEADGLGLTATQLRAFANPVFAFGGSDYEGAIVVGRNGAVDLANTRASLLFLSTDSVTGADQIRTGGRVVAVAPVVTNTAAPPTPPPQTDEFEPANSSGKEIEQPSDEDEDEQDGEGSNQTAGKQSDGGSIDEETSSELALECS